MKPTLHKVGAYTRLPAQLLSAKRNGALLGPDMLLQAVQAREGKGNLAPGSWTSLGSNQLLLRPPPYLLFDLWQALSLSQTWDAQLEAGL